MVYIARLPGFLSLAALVTIFLSASVESKMECKESSSNTVFSTDKKEDVIVVLNSDDATHKSWLKNCWGINTMSVHDDNYPSDSNELKNMASSFSVKGTKLQGYSGSFSTEFIKTQVFKRSDVKYVEKNGKVKINYAIPSQDELFKRTTDSNKPLFNLDRIDQKKYPVDGKYTFPDSAGKGVNVFVIDTGVDTKHAQFEGRAKLLKTFCNGKGSKCTKEDGNGHGSHVSGTVAGKTVGVARKANILGIRVLDDDGSGISADVINGLSFALKQHKKNKNKNSVVSMSLGGGFSQAINDGVKALTEEGVHVVVAAGNDGADACKSSPSSELSANTVGAIEDTVDEITDFSNIGKCVDIFAPGRNIISVAANTKNKLEVFSGTSQATPHVSGTIALIIAQSGNLSPAAMTKKLIDLSTKGVIKQTKVKLQGSPNQVLRVPAP